MWLGRLRAPAQCGPGESQRGLQAVLYGQQTLGKRVHCELSGLGDLLLGAAAGVLRLRLGAQIGFSHLGVLGFEFDEALLRIDLCGAGGRRWCHFVGGSRGT
jgi:hypothetical protein